MTDYVITAVRFPFWNGKDRYTMEYCPSLRTWYVFKEDETGGAIFQQTLLKPPKRKDINIETAETFMYEFIKTLPDE